jgi:hypothetical protein
VSVRSLDTPDPADERPPPSPRPSSRFADLSAGVGLVVDAGTVANSSFGARAHVDLGFGSIHAKLGVLWLPPAQSYVSVNPDQGGAVDLIASEAAACVASRGTVTLEGCLGFELGRLHGQGFGTANDGEQSVLWFAPGAGGLVRGKVTETLSVVASVGLVISLQSFEFILENVGVVHAVSPLIGRFGLGIQTEFP